MQPKRPMLRPLAFVRRSILPAFLLITTLPAASQTLDDALAQAYSTNPTLNAQRAGQRATDELVPTAVSGYRPTLAATASAGVGHSRYVDGGTPYTGGILPTVLTLTATQTLFDGFVTYNNTRNADVQVKGQREVLRNTEETVLLQAVTAYMDVLQDEALLQFQQQNQSALAEQLQATDNRFRVGEVNRTDLAQAEASVTDAAYKVANAEANLNAARATFHQVIGVTPGKLGVPRPITRLMPPTVDAAVATGLARHPAVLASRYAVEAATFQIKMAEGALAPTLSAQTQVLNETDPNAETQQVQKGTGTLSLNMPLFQGGAEYATIRKAKETLTQVRHEEQQNEDSVRAGVRTYWSSMIAAQEQIRSAQTAVTASTLALQGVQEEWRVGQRTTTDVLNAQTNLTTARSSLATAQRNSVVSAYSLLSAIGHLDAGTLNLKVRRYDPSIHLDQVRDAWAGTRTPDGR